MGVEPVLFDMTIIDVTKEKIEQDADVHDFIEGLPQRIQTCMYVLLCVCLCLSTCTCTCIHFCVFGLHLQDLSVCMCVCVSISVFTCMSVYVYMYMYLCVCIYYIYCRRLDGLMKRRILQELDYLKM